MRSGWIGGLGLGGTCCGLADVIGVAGYGSSVSARYDREGPVRQGLADWVWHPMVRTGEAGGDRLVLVGLDRSGSARDGRRGVVRCGPAR